MQTSLSSNLAEITISYASKVKFADRLKITNSEESVAAFRSIWSQGMELREECYLLLLNRANRVLGWYRASEGGIASTVVDPRIVFSVALKANACGIILAHNHPSGNLQPSILDINLTRNLVEGSKLLEISILDHIILTTEGHYSFADEGQL